MDWIFYVVGGIIAAGFVYVIGNIVYALATGKNLDKIHGSGHGDSGAPHAHRHDIDAGGGGGFGGGGGGGGD